MTSDRRHIATRAPLLKPGGLHGVVQGLAHGQAELGLRVDILHSVQRSGQATSEALQPKDGPRQVTGGSKVDHYHFAQTALDVDPDRLSAGRRRMFHFHGPWALEGKRQGDSKLRVTAKRLVEKRAYSKFDIFVSASDAFAAVLSEQYRVRRDQIFTVRPGIDAEAFCARPTDVARSKLQIVSNEFTFGIMRRLEPRMGIDVALRALVNVPNARLVVAGDGSLRRELPKLAADLGLGDRVQFLGRIDKDAGHLFYSAVDCSIVPSVALEGFGLVVLESFASGTPCIASRLGGLPEALGPWRSEWSVPPGDVGELSSLMRSAMRGSHNAADFVGYARARSWIEHARQVEKVLEVSE
jgi:glycosyltransferase involved in cell wall biosynthesis